MKQMIMCNHAQPLSPSVVVVATFLPPDEYERDYVIIRRLGLPLDNTNCELKHAIYGSFVQHGNNSGKRDTVAFHGACIECNMNVDAMGMSIATLKCIAFQTYMTLYV